MGDSLANDKRSLKRDLPTLGRPTMATKGRDMENTSFLTWVVYHTSVEISIGEGGDKKERGDLLCLRVIQNPVNDICILKRNFIKL